MRVINNAELYRGLAEEGLTDLLLCKDKGFFYITSDNKGMAERIARLETNVIYCNSLNQQPISAWISDIKDLLNRKL